MQVSRLFVGLRFRVSGFRVTPNPKPFKVGGSKVWGLCDEFRSRPKENADDGPATDAPKVAPSEAPRVCFRVLPFGV